MGYCWRLPQVARAVGHQSSMAHVADVFRGGNSAPVRNKGHDRIPEHGLGHHLRHHLYSQPFPASSCPGSRAMPQTLAVLRPACVSLSMSMSTSDTAQTTAVAGI